MIAEKTYPLFLAIGAHVPNFLGLHYRTIAILRFFETGVYDEEQSRKNQSAPSVCVVLTVCNEGS